MKNQIKAAALRYPENADAPYISASGAGKTARKILEIAQENKIPVVHNEKLTNVLCVMSAGEIIPEEVYEAVAGVFAFLQQDFAK